MICFGITTPYVPVIIESDFNTLIWMLVLGAVTVLGVHPLVSVHAFPELHGNLEPAIGAG
jgi:hypothetical protein